jgi:MoxR-like ATPase
MTESKSSQDVQSQIREKSDVIRKLREAVGQVIVGQSQMVDRLLVGLLANGHVLVEGVPGLAKTTAVKALADAIDVDFQRIQFTPDMLPSDIVGTEMYRQQTGEFYVKKGPVFANIVLADEINRAPSKVQSALLEAMQERQVTIGGETYELPSPFLVMATQNPIEQEGTYPLPEAQVDRFMMKLQIGYPSKAEEKEIMLRMASGKPPKVKAVVKPKEILEARTLIDDIHIEDRLADYIVDLIVATRAPKEYGLDLDRYLQFGASPRGTICIHRCARALAFLKGRSYVIPEDVKTIALDVLRHRVMLSYEAEAEELTSDDILKQLLDQIEVP